MLIRHRSQRDSGVYALLRVIRTTVGVALTTVLRFTPPPLFTSDAKYASSFTYYSSGLPTSKSGVPQNYGDILQYRLVFEHFLDDRHGLAYAAEVLGLHGLPFRVDGNTVNAGHTSFGLIGFQPTVEYKFTDHIVGAAGVLFTIAGYNDLAAIYPNLSVYYYWGARGGKVVPR